VTPTVARLAAALAALVSVPAAFGVSVEYGKPEQTGEITSPALPEVSGLTAARTVRGGWWVVNDGGNGALLHLLGGKGRLLASVRVRGLENRDWEELASGPAPGGRRYLYVGDIGDNDEARDDLAVYRVPEPARTARSVMPTALPFRYPDGRHDAEAMFVDPGSGRIYVITKARTPQVDPCRVYRFPLPLRPGRRVTLEPVAGRFAQLLGPVALVTGAGLSPDGTRLAVRTYLQAWEWQRRTASPFAALFAASPQEVGLALESQGESIAYTTDGRALVTTSENPPAPLWRMTRVGS
jgi:hypothetical protein